MGSENANIEIRKLSENLCDGPTNVNISKEKRIRTHFRAVRKMLFRACEKPNKSKFGNYLRTCGPVGLDPMNRVARFRTIISMVQEGRQRFFQATSEFIGVERKLVLYPSTGCRDAL